MIYDLCYFLLKGICHLFFRLRVLGKENVPKSGPVILASNHVSYLDPIFVGVSLPRRVHYMAKEEIFESLLISWFMSRLQAFPVSRVRVGPSTIKMVLQLMEKGRVLLLFPEGTRGDGKALQKAKHGIGIITRRSGAPVIPVFLQGAEKVLPRGSGWFNLHQVTVCFGSPLLLESGSTAEDGKRKGHEDFVDQVMTGIEKIKRELEKEHKTAA